MAADLFGKANEEFVNENYEKALQLYSEAIDVDSSKDDYYSSRAQVYIKLGKYEDALRDADKAIDINDYKFDADNYLWKGIAQFYLEDFRAAKDSFLEGQDLDSEDSNLKTWIRKCDAEMDLSTQTNAENSQAVGASVGADISTETTTTPNTTEPVPLPTKAQARYDWYQTQTHVVVTIMLKNVKKEDLNVDIQENMLSVTVKLPSGSDYNLELDLAHSINPSQSQTKVMSTKIEIKLKKAVDLYWIKLEGDGSESKVEVFHQTGDTGKVNAYPSSSHYTQNWDKLAHDLAEEEKNEKPEGDAALNKLFQNIYGDGSDEVKKAMMKSFHESGGTVLSTNWNEVKEGNVEVKPPDGMEYKKW